MTLLYSKPTKDIAINFFFGYFNERGSSSITNLL